MNVLLQQRKDGEDTGLGLPCIMELAAGDEYHWTSPAYQLISEAIVERTFEVLKLDGSGP